MVDRCAMCGDPVPEGRQVCPICEDKIAEGKTDDQCVVADSGRVRRRRIRDLFNRHRQFREGQQG